MNLIELSKYLNDEALAEQYLLDKGILKTWISCPHCNSDKLGKISRGRIKCYKCKKEWHKRKDSFLEGRHISTSKFIAFLKLYSADYGLMEISSEIDIERKSILQIHSELIKYIDIDSDNMSWSNTSRIIITADNDKLVMLSIIGKDITPKFNHDSYIEMSLDAYKEIGGLYSFLLKTKWVGKKKNFHLLNNFLSFAKMKSISYRGISSQKYLQYVSELVFRFNHRDEDYFELLLKLLHFPRVVETTPSHKI